METFTKSLDFVIKTAVYVGNVRTANGKVFVRACVCVYVRNCGMHAKMVMDGHSFSFKQDDTNPRTATLSIHRKGHLRTAFTAHAFRVYWATFLFRTNN